MKGDRVERVIDVPPAYADAFRIVEELDDVDFVAILDALDVSSASPSDTVVHLAQTIGGPEPAARVYEALNALALYVEDSGDGRDAAAAAVAAGLRGDDVQAQALLGERVARLLRSPGVAVPAHAQSILDAQEHLLLSVRLFTTVRPVFDSDPEVVVGSVLYHELRLEFFDAQRRKCAMVIALDKTKLDDLQAQINRSQSKQSAVQRLLNDSGLAVYELKARNDE